MRRAAIHLDFNRHRRGPEVGTVKPGDIIHDLTSILEETSPRCREFINRAIQEIEERDAEITRLKTNLVEKDVVIEEQDHYFNSFFKFTVETLNDAAEALEFVCPGRETRTFINETKKAVATATPEGRPYAVVGRVRQIIERMKETPPISAVEPTEEKFTYSLKTRTENRAMAIADFMKRTGKSSIKSTEARTVLEDIEGQELDRTIIKRAMDQAAKLLRAPKDIVGGVARLVLPTPLTPQLPPTRESGGVSLSRPRRPRVPWSG
jgi:phage host-nuclease inhibitor protein Gam